MKKLSLRKEGDEPTNQTLTLDIRPCVSGGGGGELCRQRLLFKGLVDSV